MQTAAIIAEYNPFHTGHQYHIEMTKKVADRVIVLMSSSFVQRGEPAILPPYVRAKMALLHGADLVLAMPVYFSLQGGETFAKGAIDLLSKISAHNILSFGAESSNKNLHFFLRDLLNHETPLFSSTLKENLKKGLRYAKARENTVRSLYGDELADLLKAPNNILALEYLRAIDCVNSTLTPYFVARHNDYRSTEFQCEDSFISATALRQKLYTNDYESIAKYFPDIEMAKEILKTHSPITLSSFAPILFHKLRYDKNLKTPEMNEDTLNRLRHHAISTDSIEDLMDRTLHKGLTRTRLQRILCQILIGIDTDYYDDSTQYLRVLGYNEEGQKLLKELKTQDLPIITNLTENTLRSHEALRLDLKADEIYHRAFYGAFDPKAFYSQRPITL